MPPPRVAGPSLCAGRRYPRCTGTVNARRPVPRSIAVVQRYDAAVVGAGPAGSTCAYRLASAGASVLLLDKLRFPRDKPCGGGVTFRAARELPFSLDPVVEDVVHRFRLRNGYGSAFERRSDEPLCLMTQRRRLDHLLAQKAAEAGADFRDGTRAELRDGVLHVGGEPVVAGTIVGADGVNGVTARALGRDHGVGVALEGNLSYAECDRDAYAGKLVLELGVVPGGYGWVFPKEDHVNFGVGGWEEEGPRLRAHLERLCDAHGVQTRGLTDVRGYRLPFRRAGSPLRHDDVLLVGDAAGLVDPLSGDGIYEAFVSARLASAAILDGDLDGYAPALERELGPLHSASWAAKRALDRFPRLAFALARAPVTWPIVTRIVRGELRDPANARGLGRVPLKALNRLGRTAAPA
jgi:geranylgeranyl reductase family protein